jgi:hypothetical protein
MVGTLFHVGGNQLTFTDGAGQSQTLPVAADAKVTINGEPAKLVDLWVGDDLEIIGLPATLVRASRIERKVKE